MSEALTATLRNGGLYVSRDLYDAYFKGLEGVVLLRDGVDLLVLPVRHAAAGGYFLKIRNGAGDRVVAAPDFFRLQGGSDDQERHSPVRWDSARAALVLSGVFAL